MVDLGGTYYNPDAQVEALETLLRKLPDPAAPASPFTDRTQPGRARQLDASRIQALIQGYTAGATTQRAERERRAAAQRADEEIRREKMRALTRERRLDELARGEERPGHASTQRTHSRRR
jgi:predicted RNA polymerase sigma factor